MFESQELIDDWQSWDGAFSERPEFIRILRGGLTNRSYLIRDHERSWVIRQSSSISGALGIDRFREQQILEVAAAAGLAPPVAFCAPDRDILISEYVGDQHLPVRAENDDKIIALADRIHRLAVVIPETDYYAHAENYWRQLCERGDVASDELTELRDRITRQRDEFKDIPLPGRLCHRDLIPGNIIQRHERLYVLDWEYAAFGDPTFDYASLIVDWRIAPEKIVENFQVDGARLAHAVDLYRYTCDLWHQLNILP